MKVKSGFTLIELMITVAVIGVLVAICVPTYYSHVLKNTAEEGRSFVITTQSLVDQFIMENDRFPTTVDLYRRLHVTDDEAGHISRFKYIDRLEIDTASLNQAKDPARGQVNGKS